MYAHNAIGHGIGCQAIRHHIYIVTNIQARVRHAVNTLDAGAFISNPRLQSQIVPRVSPLKPNCFHFS